MTRWVQFNMAMETGNKSNDSKDVKAMGNKRKAPNDYGHLGREQTADARWKLDLGAYVVVGFTDLGSDPAWSGSFHSCESPAARGRRGFLGASPPYQVRGSSSSPAFASSFGSISKFQN